MGNWSLETIPWKTFDKSKVRPDLVALAKAASMVEYNGRDYARYLCEVFAADEEFKAVARTWAEEEVQHGAALKQWATLADPSFDFDKSFAAFTEGYHLPVGVTSSVRGSRSGELISRCVVETGTSSYYTAIADATDEPVLQAICRHIAADELRHYKLFYTHLQRYLKLESISGFRRLRIAMGRITETEDDELSYAFYAAHHAGTSVSYDRATHGKQYMACAYGIYRKWHIERMTAMVFKAVGLKPHTWLNRLADTVAWNLLRWRNALLRGYKAQIV